MSLIYWCSRVYYTFLKFQDYAQNRTVLEAFWQLLQFVFWSLTAWVWFLLWLVLFVLWSIPSSIGTVPSCASLNHQLPCQFSLCSLREYPLYVDTYQHRPHFPTPSVLQTRPYYPFSLHLNRPRWTLWRFARPDCLRELFRSISLIWRFCYCNKSIYCPSNYYLLIRISVDLVL